MKKSRFTETQIVSILKQYDGGTQPQIFAVSMGSAQQLFTTGRPSMAVWKQVNLNVGRRKQ